MDAEEDEEKSRSQLKREFQELKELGKELVQLSRRQLEGIPMSDATREAILAAQQMARSALQRQFRYLAGLIENEDVAAIRSAMSGSPQPAAVDEVMPPDLEERWRDELISGDDQFLYEFVEDHPEFDRQQLRQLVRNARDEADAEPSKSSQKLVDYLKSRT